MTTLEDLRVLDLSNSVAGAYCTKLFADHGADVIVVEPPGGSRLREFADWFRLGTNKRSVTLDIGTETGRRLFRKMVEQANVVVESFAGDRMEAMDLGYTTLYGIKRRIILTSIPSDADDLPQTGLLAGLNAFAATAIAVYNADAYEVPQHIEIAAQDCAAFAAAFADRIEAPPIESSPFRMSQIERLSGPAPATGEHNHEIYCGEMGLEAGDLTRLRAAGVI